MNVIINNSNVQPTDQQTLFCDEPVIVVEKGDCSDLPQLLKHLGVYQSTSQARKTGRVGGIPVGWNEIRASKKVELFLWNPSE